MQIVVYGRARKILRVQWTFGLAQAAPSTGAVRRGRGEDPPPPPPP
jgi:hypothetical protein